MADRGSASPRGRLASRRWAGLDLTVRAGLPASGAAVVFEDGTFADHIGWREIVVRAGAGIRVDEADVASTSATDELRRYPPDAASAPMDVRQASFHVVPDATAGAAPLSGTSAAAVAPRGNDPLASLAAGDLTPLSAMLAVLAALALGAIHGVSPGHGKTLVAGYLIGSRGTMRQAVWLGMTVAISHTVGVLLLGAVHAGGHGTAAAGAGHRVAGAWVGAAGSHRAGRVAALISGYGSEGRISIISTATTGPHRTRISIRMPRLRPCPWCPPGRWRLWASWAASCRAHPRCWCCWWRCRSIGWSSAWSWRCPFGLGMALVLAGVSASVVVVRGRLTNGHAQWTQKAAVRRIGSALPLASALVVGL